MRAEKLRLARELHDGLAQELALIVLLVDHSESPDEAVRAAADRALGECRELIESLRDEGRRAPAESLAEALAALGRREGVAIETRVELREELDPEAQFELLRVVAEAVRNAVRHGRATRVAVTLGTDGGALVLRIADDGSGFDPRRVASSRFGLVGMRERAESLGGALTVSSDERGTLVELAVGA